MKRLSKEVTKRKYNACFRLRSKIGLEKFPARSHVIYTNAEDEVTGTTEGKILIEEFGFVVQPILFQNSN